MEFAPPPLEDKYLRRWTLQVLSSFKIRPTKKLGQNFLVSARPIRDFSRLLKDSKPEAVLEVGPGLGTLTFHLSRVTDGPYYAVELDRRLVEISEIVSGNYKTHIINGDGIKHAEVATVDTVVSNTAFNIVGELIEAAAKNNSVTNMYIVAQREVAERIAASPGTSQYGRLTIMAKLFFNIEVKAYYPSWYFFPKPKVGATLIAMTRKKLWNKGRHDTLSTITACLFSQRNKKAYKAIIRCLRREPPLNLGDKRIHELTPEEIEVMLG